MNKIALAIHGGANSGSEFLDLHQDLYVEGLRIALESGYRILEEGKSATEAVEAAVRALEDNPIFNAGKGSALNERGEVEMDAAIMDGSDLRCGFIAMVQQIKNPVSLAKAVMQSDRFVMIAGNAAMEYAWQQDITPTDKEYFITERQYDALLKEAEDSSVSVVKSHGIVGAVALDQHGNVAAATSTGGISFKQKGRIGDSCIIGAGCYANNKTCALSATGDGEYIIRYGIAHDISVVMEYTGRSLQEACDYILFEKNKDKSGEMGVIGVDAKGNTCFSFNTKCMSRASISTDKPLEIKSIGNL